MALSSARMHLAAAQLWSVSAGGPTTSSLAPPTAGLRMLAVGFVTVGKRLLRFLRTNSITRQNRLRGERRERGERGESE